jgi:hypothetical protein
MPRATHLKYLATLLTCSCIFGVSIYFSTWAVKVAGCPLLNEAGSYLAYCSDAQYGDYEHLAYALELVPAAARSLKNAEVVILGNSRTQVAFSTPQVDNFFRARSISYHVLGFGYGETGEFAAYLFRKYHLTPRVLIINADPFFTEGLTTPAQQAVAAGPQIWVDGLMKTAFEHVHGLVCRISSRSCRHTAGSVYRSFETGQWLWHGYNTAVSVAGEEISSKKKTPLDDIQMKKFHDVATQLLPSFNARKQCAILTAVPTPEIDGEKIAAALGTDLGLRVVLPNIQGMRSSDGSHLTTTSAEKWSAAFLSDSASTIGQCLAHL